jgi:hypothetical protein
MKSSALLVLMVSVAAGYSEVPVVPERLPLDRYQKLKSDPPFAVKTPDQPVEEKKIDWAESLYLSGASKFVENGPRKIGCTSITKAIRAEHSSFTGPSQTRRASRS